MNLGEVTAEDILKWRDTEKEKPFYQIFGLSDEVVGIDLYSNRKLYVYIRGVWYFSTDYSSKPVEPPIKWHYLPERPFINPLEITNELNRTTT